jgi:hypothetical protein
MDSRLDQSNQSGKIATDRRTDDLRRVWALRPCVKRPDIAAARKAYVDLFHNAAPPHAHPLRRGVTRLL